MCFSQVYTGIYRKYVFCINMIIEMLELDSSTLCPPTDFITICCSFIYNLTIKKEIGSNNSTWFIKTT